MDSLQSILELASTQPKDLTYVGIGSCPHDTIDKITDAWDQVYPVFIREVDPKKTLRLIHFDPQFTLGTTTEYFKMKIPDLSLTTTNQYWVWSNSRMEIIISKEPIYHESRFSNSPESSDWFLRELSLGILKTGGQLVVQEFTGQELSDTFKSIYSTVYEEQKSIFKKKILFDMTYGEACHCMTDMTKYKPIYNANGDFLNITLYTRAEMKKHIGISMKLDTLIFNYFNKEYKDILNSLHLVYRRNIKKAENATDEDPDAVMVLLQRKLTELFPIFKALGALPPEKEKSLKRIFENYRDHDMYKWYTAVNNHLQPSADSSIQPLAQPHLQRAHLP